MWSWIVFCAVLLGGQALPILEDDNDDLSIYFVNTVPARLSRIVGGSAAYADAHPWQAAITAGAARALHCGGAVVSASAVLTAAHCVAPVLDGTTVNPTTRIIVGTTRYATGGQSLEVKSAVTHPNYDERTLKHDIGIFVTEAEITFTYNVRPVALAYEYVGAGVQVRVAGWGRTNVNNVAFSPQLMELQTSTIGASQCASDVLRAVVSINGRQLTADPVTNICTFHSNSRGICRGDSGSPLIRIQGRQQIGIVSWGFPCALNAPDVYTRIGTYKSWIDENIGDDEETPVTPAPGTDGY